MEKEVSSAMTDDQAPIINSYVVLREDFDDWAILFNPDNGEGFGLNPTGVYVWKLLDGKHTLERLFHKIRHDAENVPEEAREHLKAFVDELIVRGLAARSRIEINLLRAMVGHEKDSSPHPERLSGRNPFSYEAPKLIYFHSDRPALGANCGYGSQDSGNCMDGLNAGQGCNAGIAAGNDCVGGNHKGGDCHNGGTPNNSCANGYTANNSCIGGANR